MKKIFLALILSSVGVAAPVVFKLPVFQTVTQVSLQIVPNNNLRSFLAISNAGPSTAYVQFGTITQYSGGATVKTLAYVGFPVISGQTLQFNPDFAPGNPAYADSPGTAALTIIEGQ